MHEPHGHSRRNEAVKRLLARIDYERGATIPYRSHGLKLDRMRQLLARLGHPERELRLVHVAGSKGKGSTSAMIASILSAAGLRTGLFTSPHLDRLEQRFVVDGKACDESELADLLEQLWPVVEAMDALDDPAMQPTYFEITTAVALLHFLRRGVDLAVLEVGLGGRLDSTNVCSPDVSVITSISLDHMLQLGDTLASIAWEKAGIIKPGVPVISGVTDAEPREVIRRVAEERGCPLIELGRDFDFRYRESSQDPENIEREGSRLDVCLTEEAERAELQDLKIGLLGRHQAANAAIAARTIIELRCAGWPIPEAATRAGLARVRMPARIEVVDRQPTVIVDAAHNLASVDALLATLKESFRPKRRWLVFATSKDKDIEGMLARLLPRFDRTILTRYRNNPRTATVEDLLAAASGLETTMPESAQSPREAWDLVRSAAMPDDLVCIAGSFHLAGEMRRLIAENPIGSQPLKRAVGVGRR